MPKDSIPAMIFAAITFIYAIPILLHPENNNAFAMVCAVIAGLTGLCLIGVFIVRFIRENKKDDQTNRKGGSDEDI
jgi:hypothetical protein